MTATQDQYQTLAWLGAATIAFLILGVRDWYLAIQAARRKNKRP